MLTEQSAERIFRALRAVLGGENFTLSEFFQRCDRITAYAMLRVLYEDTFAFPEHKSSWKWDETQFSDLCASTLPSSVTEAAVIEAINEAKRLCVEDMKLLGIEVHELKCIYSLDTTSTHEHELDEDDDLSGLPEAIAVPIAAEAVQIVVVRGQNPTAIWTLF